VKPKTFMLIAGALAAEQRTVVAHSASYGFSRPQTHQAPPGAKENYSISTQIICRAVRRSNFLVHCSHSASYGSGRRQISQAPAMAIENHGSTNHVFRPIRGLNRFANTFPRLSPWATIARHSVVDTNQTDPPLILWRTLSPIC
jgi:hypothetical protein